MANNKMTKTEMMDSLDFAIRQLDTLRGTKNNGIEWVLMRANDAIQRVLYELQIADVPSDGPKTNFDKWKERLTSENCQSFMLEVLQQVFPDLKLEIPKEASEKFLVWANAEAKEDEKMKLFISQPMRGKTDAEIEAERAKIIEEAKKRFGNVDVIDSFFAGQDTSNPVLCLSKALEKLAGADIIWFAPGWERANGCNIEHEVAKRYLGDKHIVEADAKYIVHCEANIGSGCMFSSFWNGRTFERGEKNAKVFDRRESAEEELNRFGYSKRDYSILKTTEL